MRSTPLLTTLLAAILVVLTLSSFVGAEPAASNAAAQQWEYMAVPTPELSGAARGKIPEHAQTIQNFLNQHARQGWEFNSVHGRLTIFRRATSAN